MSKPRNFRFRRNTRRIAAVIISSLISVNLITSAYAASEPICEVGPCINANRLSIDAAGSTWVVVNKQRSLKPANYVPKVYRPPFENPKAVNPRGERLTWHAGRALAQLAQAAKDNGAGSLLVQSGYRSYASQKVIHAAQVSRYGLKAGEALAARPGFSEHQTGLAVDVAAYGQGCAIQVCFGKTKMGKWLAQNAYLFGFIVRYPEGQTAKTGYQYEPWHLRYVGVDLARQMALNEVSVLEDFWRLPAAPKY